MATEAFIIAITTQGTREVKRDLQDIGTTGQAASKEVDKVKAAFTGMGKGIREATDSARATQAQLRGVDAQMKLLSTSTTNSRAALEGFGRGFQTAAEFARATQAQLLTTGRAMVEVADSTRLVSAETNKLLLQLEKSQAYWAGMGKQFRVVSESARVTATDLNRVSTAMTRLQSQRLSLGTAGGGVPNIASGANRFEQFYANQLAAGTAGLNGKDLSTLMQSSQNRAAAYGSPAYMSLYGAKPLAPPPIPPGSGRKAAQEIEETSTAAQKATGNFNTMTSSLRLMRNALVAISFLRAFEGIASGIADMQQMNNLLTTITANASDRAQAFDALAAAANRVRAPLDAFTQLFVNLERSTAGYKLSTEDAVKTTQTFFATFAISGLDTKSIANVTRDMKEVFNLGTVQGRIFRSIVMQDQEEALVLSKYIVATGQNAVAVNKKLEAMRSKGQQPDIYGGIVSGEFKGAFTGGDIQRANVAAFDEEMKKLDATTLTLSQGLSILHTSWLVFLNDINTSSGIFGNIAKALVYVGENFKGLAEILGVTLAGYLIKIVAIPVIGWLGSVAAGAVVATVEFTAMAVSALASGAAMVGSFVAGGFVAISTLTLMGITAGIAALALSGLVATLLGFLAPLTQLGTFGSLISGNLEGPFAHLKLTIADLPKVFEGVITTITSEWPLAMDTVKAVWQDMLNGLTNSWNSWWQSNRLFAYVLTGGAAGAMVAGIPGAIAGGVAGVAAAALAKGPVPAQLPTNTAGAYLSRLKANMGLNIGEAITNKGPGMPAITGQGGEAGPDDNSKAIAAYERARQEIDRLIASVDPAAAAQVRWNQALKAYRDAEKAGFPVDAELARFGLTRLDIMQRQERAAVGLGNAETDYTGRLEELAAALKHASINQKEFNDQSLVATEKVLQDRVKHGVAGSGEELGLLQNQLTTENPQERDLRITKQLTESKSDISKATDDYAAAQRILNDLVAVGAKTQEEANKQLSEYHLHLLAAQGGVNNGILAGIEKFSNGKGSDYEEAEKATTGFLQEADAARRLGIDLQVLNTLYAQGRVSVEDYTKDTRDLEIEFLRTKTDALSGFQMGLLEVQKTMNDFATTAATTVKTAFQDLQDTLVTFFDTGKLNVKKFVDDMLTNLTRLAVQKAIMAPLANMLDASGLGGVLGDLTGGSSSGQLGSSASNPMYVTMANGGLGGSGSGGLGGSGSGDNGGLLGGGNIFGGSTGFMSNLFNGGGGPGSLSDSILSMFGGDTSIPNSINVTGSAFASSGFLDSLGSMLGFASGGDFTVGGQGGTDSQLVPIRATPGEVVSVRHPGDSNNDSYGGQRNTIIMHVHGATDPDTFRRSTPQIASNLHGALSRVQARG